MEQHHHIEREVLPRAVATLDDARRPLLLNQHPPPDANAILPSSSTRSHEARIDIRTVRADSSAWATVANAGEPSAAASRPRPAPSPALPSASRGCQGFGSGGASASTNRRAHNEREEKQREKEGGHRVKRASLSDSFRGRYAVEVRGVTHAFGKKTILQRVDMQLRVGQIYGLLGPSGCGKTTLIKCLLAQLEPKEGDIRCFGESPASLRSQVPGHDVGYMPQEIALYDEFTIWQNLAFYAKMHGMSNKQLKERGEYLCRLLDLQDPKKRQAGKLSGGQQRRTSLACSLLHSPKLLILDEPTVGVDPTLRTKIWKYLMRISRDEGTTILLTTHYIEEARNAHAVGLMRDGRMLAQGTPKEIMQRTKSKTLESAFLKICKSDEKKEGEKSKDGGGDKHARNDEQSPASDNPEDEDESEDDDLADGGAEDEEGDGSGSAPVSLGEGAVLEEKRDDGGDDAAAEDDESAKDPSARARPGDSSKDRDGGKREEGGGKPSASPTFSSLSSKDYAHAAPELSPEAPSSFGKAAGRRHLQSPIDNSGRERHDDDDDEERLLKGKHGQQSDSAAHDLTGWQKFQGSLGLPRCQQLWALCWKNLQRMLRGLAGLIFQFVLPSVQVILFCVAIGKDPQHVRMGIVNHDNGLTQFYTPTPIGMESANSADLLLPPASYPSFVGRVHDDPPPSNFLTQDLLQFLDKHFRLSHYPHESQARAAVETNSVWGYIFIPTNFTQNTIDRIEQMIIDPTHISNQTIANSTLSYTLDMSNEQMTIYLVKSIAKAYGSLLNKYAPNLQRESPLQMHEPVYGDEDASFTDFVAPGIIITIAFSNSIGMTAITFVLDKKTGNMDRIWSCGAWASEIMLAQVITQLLIFVVQIGLLLLFGLVVFKLPLEGSVVLLFLVCLVLGVTGMMFGLVIASKVREERDAMQAALGLFFPALLLSGVMVRPADEQEDARRRQYDINWPVEAIPIPLYWLSLGLPTTWAAEAGRSIMSRGWGITHRQVWLGLVVPCAWSIVFFLWAARSLRAKKS